MNMVDLHRIFEALMKDFMSGRMNANEYMFELNKLKQDAELNDLPLIFSIEDIKKSRQPDFNTEYDFEEPFFVSIAELDETSSEEVEIEVDSSSELEEDDDESEDGYDDESE